MYEIIFLSVLALIWIIFATIEDLKKREIANWINFSLIIFALGFRFFYSLFSELGFGFFYQGLIGLGIFFVLGNILYYSKMFAGGDAKLFFALGPILPFYSVFALNFKIFLLFFLIFLFVGALYGLVSIFVLSIRGGKKFKKEFKKQLKSNSKLIYPALFLGLALMLLGLFFETMFFWVGVFFFILPYLYVYTKAVDEVCMVKKIKTSELTEGDWLYQDVKIGNKTIKAKWGGVNKKEMSQIRRKYKSVLVRYGIQYSPVFFISFLVLFYLWKIGLWNSFW